MSYQLSDSQRRVIARGVPPHEHKGDPFHGLVLGVAVSLPMWAIVCAFIWWIVR